MVADIKMVLMVLPRGIEPPAPPLPRSFYPILSDVK